MAKQWTPVREWEPELEERVVDKRPGGEEQVGIVLRHADPLDTFWQVSVLWEDSGVLEHGVSTAWLTREDGTQ